ncbi:hypothetical protein K2173_007983 [Erythroxylum novogranatense]|uniref:QWRF motif-containing protein 2 n=1 Tax=Erythroxylum novogranatense TaxID=1862640 RepID=A0AAV8T884_9ROSI|nr:hypothetical protein K2173_007983 [Erythroxylum novogranatense]
MVAAVSTPLNTKTTSNQNLTRRPLLPSDQDNAPRRTTSREVASRYMSYSSSSSSSTSSASKRCPSPFISRTTAMTNSSLATPSTVKRSLSVERRRPSTPRCNLYDLKTVNGNSSQLSNANKLLVTSTRSLSVSFQGESFSLQVSKARPAPSQVSLRKATPERRKTTTPANGGGADQAENLRPAEQQRWPGRLRQADSMSRSVDFTDDKKRLIGSEVSTSVVRSLQGAMLDYRSSIESRLSSDSNTKKPVDVNGSNVQCGSTASDTESVSSGSTTESNSSNGGVGGQAQPELRGTIIAARFFQQNSKKIRRQTEAGSPVKNNGQKGPAAPRVIPPKRIGIDSPVSSPKGVVNSRGQLSPIRGGAMRTASPSKVSTPAMSVMRAMSPSRMRNAVGAVVGANLSNLNSTPSILSFAADIRRGKIGENRIVEVHLLRILYNRLLQWRFINARADASLYAQRLTAEKSMYGAHVTISKLRESVRTKQMELQWLRQNLKLISILKGQMTYLEELELMDQDYSRSLSGATEALRASTLRLPVVGGARADVHNIKDAICSAVDVMQAMASSIRFLSIKVGDVNSMVAELANATSKERALLGQCKDLLSVVAALQVKDCSLQTHILQLNRVPKV